MLTEDGFIQQILREARLIKKEVRAAVNSKSVKEAVLASTNIDWRGASKSARKRSIKAMADLIEGLPTDFARGVRAVFDTEAKKVVDDTHQRLGSKFDQLSVDPVFALKNEQAIAAINDTTTMFFAPEYASQAQRFESRARKQVVAGLEQGLGNREIGRELRQEFNDTAIHDSYWDTVAAVHVNRARSYSSVATYSANGLTQFEVLAVGDERTTPICEMMNGTLLPVESAMDAYDAFEDATNLKDVKERISPFMHVHGNQIVTRTGQQIAGINQNGSYSKVTPGKMNEKGVNTPPYHFRCRSTTIPVLDSASVIVAPKAVKPTDVQPDQPKPPPKDKPKKPRRRRKPKKPDPLVDPVATAATPTKARKGILDQIKDGRGFVPGTLSTAGEREAIYGPRGTKGSQERRKHNAAIRKLNDKMADAFLARGKGIVAGDPQLQALWNSALAKRGQGGFTELTARREAVKELIKKTKRMGIESIPQAERAERREKFIAEVVSKARQGEKQGGRFVAHPGAAGNLTAFQKRDLETWAGEFFDAWGPLAEGALSRNTKIIKSSGRAHNSQHNEYFSYPRRETFHHEFGHSIEHHVNYPRDKAGGTNRDPSEEGSYWRRRIERRDRSRKEKLSRVTGNSAYNSWEVTKKDKWADPYMGKLYPRGSTEIVSMFTEAFGGNVSDWRLQFEKDPDALLEFLGYMQSVIQGENTRQARLKAGS